MSFEYPKDFKDWDGAPVAESEYADMVTDVQKGHDEDKGQYSHWISTGDTFVVSFRSDNSDEDFVYICKIIKAADRL